MPIEDDTPAEYTTVRSLREQSTEDPCREPHEKETAFHVGGDEEHFSVTSFKKVVYVKLLQRPEFNVQLLHVLTTDGQYGTVPSIEEAAADPSLSIIGVVGKLPVGAMNIGTPRNDNTHASLVK